MTQTDGEQPTAFREDRGDAAPPAPPPNPGAKKTSTGLEENVAGLLCYVLGLITGILFLVLEKENRFVRFHALQSILFSAALFVLNVIVNMITFIGWLMSLVLNPLALILWLFLMYKAFTGAMYKLPWLGDLAERQLR